MSKRILIAEDDAAIARLIAMNLKAAGMEPVIFPDGEAAAGSYDERASVHGTDAVGLLAEDFNKMADAVQEKIASLAESEQRKTMFMADFSHELKTPLTAISGYAQGYEPLIDGDTAVIVLPLCCVDDEKPGSVRISVKLQPEPQSEPKEEPVILMPKILVQRTDGGSVQAGESAELHITLKNTSRTEALQNLTLTASAAAPFSLQSADTLYYEKVAANAEFEAVFVCKAASDAAAGAYTLPLQFNFAYGKGMTVAGSGNVRLTVTQPVRMEFPAVVFRQKRSYPTGWSCIFRRSISVRRRHRMSVRS